MRVAISGATGYLGRKLIECFCSEGHSVLAITRTQNSQITALGKRFGALLTICELETEELLFTLGNFSPDVVFSTTCCYETDAKFLNKTVSSNYLFPAQLLKNCMQINADGKKAGVRFISIGTSLPENLNLYSLTKKQFGDLGYFFSEMGKIQFINVLLESFYGFDEPDNRFIHKSIASLLRNENLEVTEGVQHRDYIFLDDVLDILYYLSVTALTENHYAVPVGTGVSPSIREILTFLHGETHSKSKILYGAKPMRKNEPSTCADISVLRSLGYTKQCKAWKDGMALMVKKLAAKERNNENID